MDQAASSQAAGHSTSVASARGSGRACPTHMQPTATAASGSSAEDFTPGSTTPLATGSSAPSQSTDLEGSSGSSAAGHIEQSSVQLQPQPVTTSRIMTRLQKGIRNPKVRTDGTIPYGMLCISGEPTRLSDALGDPKWKRAMDEEYDALMNNKTWHLVPSQRGKNIIDCKWVYRIKRKADASIDRYNGMVLIMRTLLVLLSKLPPSDLCWLLLFPEDGVLDS